MRCKTLTLALQRCSWLVHGIHFDQAEFLQAIDDDKSPTSGWVVLDRYDVIESFEHTLKNRGFRVLTITDGPMRHYSADVLLDPNLSDRTEASWRPYCDTSTRILCGGRFLLLREEFWFPDTPRVRQVPEVATKFLISMGATDPAGLAFRILDAFTLLAKTGSVILDDARVTVIAGRENPRADELRNRCDQLPFVEFVLHAETMRPYLAAADLCIGSAGQSTWERFAVGVPSLVAAVAENQCRTLELMASQGLLCSLGWHEQIKASSAAHQIEQLARSRLLRQGMADAGLKQLGHLEFLQNPAKWLES